MKEITMQSDPFPELVLRQERLPDFNNRLSVDGFGGLEKNGGGDRNRTDE